MAVLPRSCGSGTILPLPSQQRLGSLYSSPVRNSTGGIMARNQIAAAAQNLAGLNTEFAALVKRYVDLLEDPRIRKALGNGRAVVECVLHDSFKPALAGLLELQRDLARPASETPEQLPAFLERAN